MGLLLLAGYPDLLLALRLQENMTLSHQHHTAEDPLLHRGREVISNNSDACLGREAEPETAHHAVGRKEFSACKVISLHAHCVCSCSGWQPLVRQPVSESCLDIMHDALFLSQHSMQCHGNVAALQGSKHCLFRNVLRLSPSSLTATNSCKSSLTLTAFNALSCCQQAPLHLRQPEHHVLFPNIRQSS